MACRCGPPRSSSAPCRTPPRSCRGWTVRTTRSAATPPRSSSPELDRSTRPTVELFDTTQLALGAALRGANSRQGVLAGNLANIDTPGYVRKDVDFHGTLAAALQSGDDPVGAGFAAADDAAAAVRADGNSVDVDAENSALAQNALEYDALTRVSTARIDILKTAMGVSA